jgi:hypothetical protein
VNFTKILIKNRKNVTETPPKSIFELSPSILSVIHAWHSKGSFPQCMAHKRRLDFEVMVYENEDGFVDAGATNEGGEGTQKTPDTMGVPLIPPTGPYVRKKRPLDYLVCVLVVVSILINIHKLFHFVTSSPFSYMHVPMTTQIFMVASAQFTSMLQIKYNFNNPAFIIWFSTSYLIMCFPIQIIYHICFQHRKGSIVEILGGKYLFS